jgi:putative inorganic carbon (hco3(-)) transporter
MDQTTITYNDSKWFFFTMLWLVVDYARPQDLVRILEFIKPGMLIIIILTCYLVIHNSRLIRADSKQIRMILLFIALLALFVPFAVNNFLAYSAVKTMVLYMPFTLSVIICVNSIERLKTTMFVCLSIMVYIATYGVSHHGVGSGNYFQDENDLTLFLDMWLPFCFCMFIYEKTWKKKLSYIIGLIIGLATIITSLSRGGYVGLLAMVSILWLFSSRKIISFLIILVLSLSFYLVTNQAYRSEMSTITDTKENTAHIRIMSWQTAWDMFLDNPLGVGGNNFQVRFYEYQGDRFPRGMWGRVAHSIWFTLISETGIFGIIIYLMLLYYNIRDIFKIKRLNSVRSNPDDSYLYYLSWAMLASLAGFFASATFISVLYYPHYWYMTAIIVATMNIAKKRSEVLIREEVKSGIITTVPA